MGRVQGRWVGWVWALACVIYLLAICGVCPKVEVSALVSSRRWIAAQSDDSGGLADITMSQLVQITTITMVYC